MRPARGGKDRSAPADRPKIQARSRGGKPAVAVATVGHRELKPDNAAIGLASPDPPRRLTLAAAAAEIGLEGNTYGRKRCLRLLRGRELATGRTFLHVEGSGSGRRYSITRAGLEEALGGLISAKREGDERKGEIAKLLAAQLGPVRAQLEELLEKTVVMERAAARLVETVAKLEARAQGEIGALPEKPPLPG